jgi:hypothetical protein
MKTCPHCGNENEDRFRLCQGCGARLVSEELRIEKQLEDQVVEIATQQGKIAAIKLVREQQHCDLATAKSKVEAILAQRQVALPQSGCLGMLLLTGVLSAGLAGAVLAVQSWSGLLAAQPAVEHQSGQQARQQSFSAPEGDRG